MLHLLAGLTLLLTGADHWTTYLCLRRPVAGWEVVEANPVADWLFTWAGLVPGLWIDTAVTLVAVGFLLLTDRLSRPFKAGFLGLAAAWTGAAVVNNLDAIERLGLSPFGWS